MLKKESLNKPETKQNCILQHKHSVFDDSYYKNFEFKKISNKKKLENLSIIKKTKSQSINSVNDCLLTKSKALHSIQSQEVFFNF